MDASNLAGIIPPMITPFDADGRVDEAAFRADVRYLVQEAAVSGLAVGGSTGEGTFVIPAVCSGDPSCYSCACPHESGGGGGEDGCPLRTGGTTGRGCTDLNQIH